LSNVARSKNQFKYNGQEFQDELELNMTAMDFRQYDNALGRFHGVDLLAEVDYSGSPYSFGFNNPVYFSDPSGLTPDPPPIDLNEVEVKSNFKPKPKKKSSGSPFKDMSFAQISIGGGGNFGISDNGGGVGRNEIGVTMSPMGLVALNAGVIEGARMKRVVSSRKNPRKAPTLTEANEHYRNGNGTPFYVDAATVDLNFVDTNGMVKNREYLVKTLISSKHGRVFGKLRVIYKGNNQVRIIDNDYDFNIEFSNPPKFTDFFSLRNYLTGVGHIYAGEGTSYPFVFVGLNTIIKAPSIPQTTFYKQYP
jgi:RHS repeat-associated protein